MVTCPLCKDRGSYLHKDVHLLCDNCRGIFLNPERYFSPEEEKRRYEEHINDVEDTRYQNFVMPIVEYVTANYSANRKGLDFGSGTGPVISKMLDDRGYIISQYDPFFARDEKVLQEKYDYIVCCEVIEHFHRPDEEFKLLKGLLSPQGQLICMTHLYHPEIDFKNWYYKNDRTHVFIYQKETVAYIAERFDWKIKKMDGRMFVLQG